MDRLLILRVSHLNLALVNPTTVNVFKPALESLEHELKRNAKLIQDMRHSFVAICLNEQSQEQLLDAVKELETKAAKIPWALELAVADPFDPSYWKHYATVLTQSVYNKLSREEPNVKSFCERIQQERQSGTANRLPTIDSNTIEIVATRRPVGRQQTKIYLKMALRAPFLSNMGLILYLGPLPSVHVLRQEIQYNTPMRRVVNGPDMGINVNQNQFFTDSVGRRHRISSNGMKRATQEAGYEAQPRGAAAMGQNCASCAYYLQDPLDPMQGYCKLFEFMVDNRAWCAEWEQA